MSDSLIATSCQRWHPNFCLNSICLRVSLLLLCNSFVACRLQEWLDANSTGQMGFSEFCGWFHLVHADIDRLRPQTNSVELEVLQAEIAQLKQELGSDLKNADSENQELKAEVQKLQKMLEIPVEPKVPVDVHDDVMRRLASEEKLSAVRRARIDELEAMLEIKARPDGDSSVNNLLVRCCCN